MLMIKCPSKTLRNKHVKGIISCVWFSLKRFSCTHTLSILAFVCILFTCHLSHLHIVILCFCVFMCLVIRFQLLFGNVRACTLGAYFCAMIAVGECPWLLPWFHQNWRNGGLDQWPGRRMKPPNGKFQGQSCLFTQPILGLYKYIFFSCSSNHSHHQEPYFHKREKAN